MFGFDGALAATVAAVVDEGTFEAAARRLRLTPSAVSQRVKTMEAQLGRVLLVRARPVRPTEAGEAVLRLARQLALLEHDTAADLGLDVGVDARIRVPLAVDADSLATWFLAPIARVSDQHPIDVELHRADPRDSARLLESGEVMAAVTSEAQPVAGCTVMRLGSLPYQAIASPGYARRWFVDGPTPDALQRAPFIGFDRRDTLQTDWLSQRGVDHTATPRRFVPSSHDLLRAVQVGVGWAMVPSLQAADAISHSDAVALGGDSVHVSLYWQQWSLRSSILAAVGREVAAEARLMLDA